MPLASRTQSAARLLGTNEIFVADSIVTVDEQLSLVDWAEEKQRNGRLLTNPRDSEIYMTPFLSEDGGLTRFAQQGPTKQELEGRQRGFVWIPQVTEQFLDQPPESFWTIRSRVVDVLGLHGVQEDHYKGSFLSYIVPGGRVHEHRDARVKVEGDEFLILRCNVLFKKPQQGGMPIIGSQEIDISDRGMWAFFPTEFRHSTTVVHGTECRGTLSFGFLLHPEELWERRFRVTPQLHQQGHMGSPDRLFHGIVERQHLPVSVRERQEVVWEFVASQTGDFSVREVAKALDESPSDVWQVLRDLQASRLIQSLSSASLSRGRVLLFRELLISVSDDTDGRSC